MQSEDIKCNNLNRKIEKTNYRCENTCKNNNLRIVSTNKFFPTHLQYLTSKKCVFEKNKTQRTELFSYLEA